MLKLETTLPDRVLETLGLDADVVDAIVGDLAEELALRTARDGALRARFWYIRELLRSAPHLVAAVLRRGGPRARILVAALIGAVVLTASVTTAFIMLRNGPPARLTSDLADDSRAILLNNTRPVTLAIKVLDRRGHSLDPNSVEYQRIGGAPISVTSKGVVTCDRPADAVVRASVGTIATDFNVRCRPVKEMRSLSWVDLVAGGAKRELSFTAVGTNDRPVQELRGVVHIADSSVASVAGMMVEPRGVGRTMIEVEVGDRRALFSAIVHEVVGSFASLRPDQRYVAMPVRLVQGDTVRWPLPPGNFWLKYIPKNASDAPPSIWMDGRATCSSGDGLRAFRVPLDVFSSYCNAEPARSWVALAHGRLGAEVVEGTLMIDRVW